MFNLRKVWNLPKVHPLKTSQDMLRPIIHDILHFLIPALVAYFGFKENRLRVFLIMMATMAVDLDHLLADPIYDPSRCSINFHPLHSYAAIGVYCILPFFSKLRLIGIGLLIHMALDFIDCVWMEWPNS